MIFSLMKSENKNLATWEQTLELLESEKIDVVLTMGAGNIDRMSVQIIEILKNKI